MRWFTCLPSVKVFMAEGNPWEWDFNENPIGVGIVIIWLIMGLG